MENLNYVFTLINGTVPDRAKITIDRNRLLCDYLHIPFKVIEFETPQGKSRAGVSDILRIKQAGKDECILYVDWDCLIVDFPVFNANFPRFGIMNNRQLDIFMFYNGKKLDLFRGFLEYVNPTGAACEFGHRIDEWFKNQYQVIYPSCFAHYGLAQGRETL